MPAPRSGWTAGILLAISHIENEGGADTLDVYDTGPLAFADLVRAIRDTADDTLEVNEEMLLDGLRAVLERGGFARRGGPVPSGGVAHGVGRRAARHGPRGGRAAVPPPEWR